MLDVGCQTLERYAPSSLFTIINAPITPGTHPHSVNRKMMIKDPHPLSITASGGRKIHTMALRIFMALAFNMSNG